MPPLKRLLLSAHFETAQRRRQCSRSREHEIPKGDDCLVIRNGMTKRNYCLRCASRILQKAEDDLGILAGELENRNTEKA